MISCFHTVALHKHDIPTTIDLIAEYGYDSIEWNAETLPWAEPHITPKTSKEVRSEINALVKAKNLKNASICAHIPMIYADKEKRQEAIDYVKGCVDLAVDLNAPNIHILSGPRPEDVTVEEARTWFNNAVLEIVTYASSQNVSVGIEAIAGHFFHSINDFRRLKNELPNTDFKVNFDPSQLIVQNEDPVVLIKEMGEKITHVHLKDGDGIYPNFSFPPLGQGKIDFKEIAKSLSKVNFDAALSIEYEANAFGIYEEQDVIMRHGLEFINQFFDINAPA